MKRLLLVLAFLLVASTSYSQTITNANFESNFNSLLENLNKEEWRAAEKLCAALLTFAEPTATMDTEKMLLRYMKLYIVAGLLNEKVLTKEEALKRTQYLKGKKMILPAHPFNPKCYVNCTQFGENEKDTFFTSANNKAGTQILAFEHVKIKGGIQETSKQLQGKFVRLKGTLSDLSVQGYTLPRFELHFTDGEYEVRGED